MGTFLRAMISNFVGYVFPINCIINVHNLMYADKLIYNTYI